MKKVKPRIRKLPSYAIAPGAADEWTCTSVMVTQIGFSTTTATLIGRGGTMAEAYKHWTSAVRFREGDIAMYGLRVLSHI